MKQKTVMSEAFAEAGYLPPPTLDELAIQAWGKYSGALMLGARLGFLREALKGEPLHAELFRRFDERAVNVCLEKLLCEAKEKIAAARPETPVRESRPGGRGHLQHETRMAVAPSTQSLRAEPQPIWRDEWSATKPARPAPARPTLKEMADRQSAAMASKFETVVRLSKLDEIVIDGQKLGDLTPREATAWAGKHELKARFVRMVCANLPEADPIRKWIKPDEADELYRRAQEAV